MKAGERTPQKDQPSSLKDVLNTFVQQRLDAKLKQLSADDPKRELLVERHKFPNWVKDAANRIAGLELATHSVKGIHPYAKGTNLFVSPETLSVHDVVGSHVLPSNFTVDAVGDAGALAAYAFLMLEHGGRSVLDRVLDNDPELLLALSDDQDQAKEWVQSFSGITKSNVERTSSNLAKQLYWLVGNDPLENNCFHLLAPLYPNSLTHHVFEIINHDRFGEHAQEARRARRDKRGIAHGYHDYPDLAIQKIGGANPQNVGRLVKKRSGNNYLLASLPPAWQTREVREPLHVDSVFARFQYRRSVRTLLYSLNQFLKSDPTPTMQTRDRRQELTAALIDELLQFAAEIRTLPPGWSAQPECRLAEPEALWLDPGRAEFDEAFHDRRQRLDWPAEIRHRFANWLNRAVGKKLPLGDTEHRQWAVELAADPTWVAQLDADQRWMAHVDRELAALQEEIQA